MSEKLYVGNLSSNTLVRPAASCCDCGIDRSSTWYEAIAWNTASLLVPLRLQRGQERLLADLRYCGTGRLADIIVSSNMRHDMASIAGMAVARLPITVGP